MMEELRLCCHKNLNTTVTLNVTMAQTPYQANPFMWFRALDNPSDVVGMDDFAGEVAMALKGRANVAIFGARGTGKSSFLTRLEKELTTRRSKNEPRMKAITINLETALSIPAFIACVNEAMQTHPDRTVHRQANANMRDLEREIGFNIKLIRGSFKTKSRAPREDELAVMLHAQLRSLAKLGDHVAVLFDEFQRLRSCPGEPLGIIRSALLGTQTPNVSMLVTGSMREGLKMLLHDSRRPIFDQTIDKQLPEIPYPDFVVYLERKFHQTEKPISETAAERIVDLCEGHPKRTQQLAASVWDQHQQDTEIEDDAIDQAFDAVLARESPIFKDTFAQLAEGTKPDVNEARALFALADGDSEHLTSRVLAAKWGLSNYNALTKAAERLRRRGLVESREDNFRIVDPLLRNWLKQHKPLD